MNTVTIEAVNRKLEADVMPELERIRREIRGRVRSERVNPSMALALTPGSEIGDMKFVGKADNFVPYFWDGVVYVPVRERAVCYLYDAAGALDVSAGWTDVKWDTGGRVDDTFAHETDSATITILKAGDYLVSFQVTTALTAGNGPSGSQAQLLKNAVAVGGSLQTMFNYNSTSAEATGNTTLVLHCEISDALKVQAKRDSGSDTIKTVADGCRFFAERLP